MEITTTEKTSSQTLKDKPSFLEVYYELSFLIKDCSHAPKGFIASIKISVENLQDPAEIEKVIEKYKKTLEQIQHSLVKEEK